MTEIVDAEGISDEALLATINQAFGGQPKPKEWFQWKHRSGPWGRSHGFAAVSGDEVVGVRLFVPWLARRNNGVDIHVLRAMDGAILPAARRQGLFSRLVDAQLNLIRSGEQSDSVVYSTSVPASREAYRKLGWSIFDVSQRLVIPVPRHAKLRRHEWPSIPDYIRQVDGDRLATAWSGDSLRWRTDPRSGNDYVSFSLAEANGPNGIILRRAVRNRIPIAVVLHLWGSMSERIALASAVGIAVRCAALWCNDEAIEIGRLRRIRGCSSISLWASSSERQIEFSDPHSWAFSYADLEGVM